MVQPQPLEFEADGTLEITLSKARAMGASIAEGNSLASAGDVPGDDVVVRHDGHAALGAFLSQDTGTTVSLAQSIAELTGLLRDAR